MSNFIEQITVDTRRREQELRERLHQGARRIPDSFQEEIRAHWHPLPGSEHGPRRPGFAVDGSNRRADLANGSVLFVAQSMILGEGLSDLRAEIEILPGTVKPERLERFADLMRQSLEIRLAADHAARLPRGSVLYLDGALYGTFPQLYSMAAQDIPRDYAAELVEAYRDLFQATRESDLLLVSIAKTNREPLFYKVLRESGAWREAEKAPELSDSVVWGELAGSRAGHSTPVLLGRLSFDESSDRAVLQGQGVGAFPAIVSFFVRLADFDDPLRIDFPVSCLGRDETLADLKCALLPPGEVHGIVQDLQGDYGGLQVYNALAYVTDREVRLTRRKMYDVYVPLIGEILGEELRLDRSQRRFVD